MAAKGFYEVGTQVAGQYEDAVGVAAIDDGVEGEGGLSAVGSEDDREDVSGGHLAEVRKEGGNELIATAYLEGGLGNVRSYARVQGVVASDGQVEDASGDGKAMRKRQTHQTPLDVWEQKRRRVMRMRHPRWKVSTAVIGASLPFLRGRR